jgi:hypothetical protein
MAAPAIASVAISKTVDVQSYCDIGRAEGFSTKHSGRVQRASLIHVNVGQHQSRLPTDRPSDPTTE